MAFAARARPAARCRFRASLPGCWARLARAAGSLSCRVRRRQTVLLAGTLRRVDRHPSKLTDDDRLGANFSCVPRSIRSCRVIDGVAVPRGAFRR